MTQEANKLMKTAIIYSTRTGATQLCAEYIASQLPECPVFNLEKDKPDLSLFDTIFIGSGVRMGNLYKPVKKLLADNTRILSEKNTVIFLCNYYPKTTTKTIEKNIPKELAANSRIISCGGKPPFGIAMNIDWLKCSVINDLLTELNLD